ncbi:hypothetical protein ACW9IB_03880 [Pseudomonas sp. SDO524_S393]
MTASPSTEPHQSLTDALIAQMSTGPAFREVAATLLREQLQALYPTLDIDPNTAVVGTPLWDIEDDQVVPAGRHYQVLTDVLAVQSVLAVPTLYIEGQHFLTQLPVIEPAIHLPVRILDIASILNTLAPVMLRGYQQAQLEYWNTIESDSGPRWHGLSTMLRDHWNLIQVPGWTTADCQMARQLFQTPDAATRKQQNPNGVRAYVVDVDQIDDAGNTSHLDENLISVLVGKPEGTEVVLTHSLMSGFKKYRSLDELGKDLSLPVMYKKLEWRLVEPDGDFFDYLASAFIGIQTKAIGAIDFSYLREPNVSQHVLAQPPTPRAKRSAPALLDYIQALPEWLTSATAADQAAYSRHLKDLAALHNANEGRTYDEGISPLPQYTLERLSAEMLKDHPDALTQWLSDLDIVVRSPVVWGTFAVPGQIDTTVFSLVELALQNLIALPLGIKSLRLRNPHPLPDWLTVEYLEGLISRVDIGSTYLALIRRTLLDNAQESARRRSLYAQHLRIQLPLLALQCKLRHENGIDEQGYAYVKAVTQAETAERQVQGQRIVMRALAFVPTRRQGNIADQVTNMFVIGPEDPTAGPCLLYRPLLDKPLSQFPSQNNLLYALQQSRSLRDSVLAWLPDDVRDDYAQYVFPGDLPSPWAVVEFLADPFKLWIMGGPLALGQEAIEGDLPGVLYDANANALITLADRQSVSNAEARWATFKRAGWLIFNSALPFLGRTVGAAAWIWQIMDQLQTVVDTREHPEQRSTWAALAELLLNLGTALTLHSVTRTTPRRLTPGNTVVVPKQPSPPTPVSITRLTPIASDALIAHDQPLHVSGAINRAPARLATVLDSFMVVKPDALGEVHNEPGAYHFLYGAGQSWYAPVAHRWFKVLVDENDDVQIVDPAQPSRTGPLLIHNSSGQWFIDTRLRLRGGGPKLLTAKARAQASQKAQKLRERLEAFEKGKRAAQDELQRARQALDTGPSTSADALRHAYIQTLETQRTEYESALQMLKEMNVHEPSAEYAPKALNYIKAQAGLTQAALSDILARFTPKWRSVHDQIQRQIEVPQERYIEDFRELRELAGKLLVQLEYMHGRFTELKGLARDGALLLNTLKGSMPVYTPDDLKAIRISLTRNLCLPETSIKSTPQAWLAIDQIVDTADIAIQCLRDTLEERSDRRLDERIDTLSSLIEQFQLLDERLQDFPVEFSEQAITDQLLELRGELSEFQHRATSNLGMLSLERTALRNRPTPPSTPPRPRKQFIHTRYNGLLIGEPRLTDLGLETGLVDIRSPLTQQVLATYHEKTKGVWVVRDRTPPPSAGPIAVDVQQSISQGQHLLSELPAFLARARTHANLADRAPFGIEHLYHQHASRLELARHSIEQALTQRNITDSDALSAPASAVIKALDGALADLYQQSNQLVQRTLKLRPPTVSGVEWLKRHNVISIKKSVARRRIKSINPDYLDEYTISDRVTGQVLWYAHFHYSTHWTPDKAYVSARLKNPAEHALGSAADSPDGLSRAQTVAFYRSEISLEQARELFFERPKSGSGS